METHKVILRKLFAFVLCGAMLAGCASSNEPVVPEEKPSEPISNVETEIDVEESDPVVEEPKEEEPLLPHINSMMETVTGVSDEWLPGQYVVNGLDYGGNPVGAIMNADGTAKVFENYCGLYPLADGNLLAATQIGNVGDTIPVTTAMMSEGKTVDAYVAGVVGEIIDQNGNVLYAGELWEGMHADALRRMYIINSHTILMMFAAPGFEGSNAYGVIIDNHGNILSEDLFPAHNFLEPYGIQIAEDGYNWNFTKSSDSGTNKVYRSARYDGSEGRSVQFGFDTMFNDSLYICHVGQPEVADIDWLAQDYSFQDGIFYNELDDNTLLSTIRSYEVGKETEYLWDEGSILASIEPELYLDNLGCDTESGMPCFYYTLGDEIYNIDGEVILKLPTSYKNPDLKDGRLVFELRGQDKLDYVSVLDIAGNEILEPYRLNGGESAIGLKGKKLAYINNNRYNESGDMKTLHVVDLETKTATEIYGESFEGEPVEIRFMDEDKVAVTFEYADDKYCEHMIDLASESVIF